MMLALYTVVLSTLLLAAALFSRDVVALAFVALLVVPATLHLARR
jgi:hypothetical protein